MKKIPLVFQMFTPLIFASLFGTATMSAYDKYLSTGRVDFTLVILACIGLAGALVFQFAALWLQRTQSQQASTV